MLVSPLIKIVIAEIVDKVFNSMIGKIIVSFSNVIAECCPIIETSIYSYKTYIVHAPYNTILSRPIN